MTEDRDIERSHRVVLRTVRLTITTVAMYLGIVLACLRPEVAGPIAAMICVLGFSSLLTEYFNREGPSS